MTWWKRSPYRAVSTGSNTGRSSVAASLAVSVTAVLDLPGVVEHVPGHPAHDVPHRPLPVLAAADALSDHCALLVPRGARGHSRTCLGGIAALGFDDVAAYVVAVATAAARALAQSSGCGRRHLVEVAPDLPEQVQLPVELRLVERFQVPLGRHGRRTEVRGRVSGDPTDDRRLLRRYRRADGGGIAVGVRQQLFDGRFVTLGAATPARPVEGAREGPFLTALEVDPNHP